MCNKIFLIILFFSLISPEFSNGRFSSGLDFPGFSNDK